MRQQKLLMIQPGMIDFSALVIPIPSKTEELGNRQNLHSIMKRVNGIRKEISYHPTHKCRD